MKNLILFILLISGFSIKTYSQRTYYNPSNKVDFTITIREAYKPVDYGKIGRDFNTMIQDELERRENLKRYYYEIYYQTKSSVYSSTVLTSDNLVNSKILMVQKEVIDKLDTYYSLLRGGLMNPDGYESWVKNIFYTYMNSNQVFLQIVQYKYNKDLELDDQTKISEHDKLYNNTLNSIIRFEINNPQKIEFVLDGLVYPNTNSTNLYEFVRSSSEGEYDTYKNNLDVKLKNELKYLEIQKDYTEVYDRIYILRKNTFDLRKEILSKLDDNGREIFRKEERDFIILKIRELYDLGWTPPQKGNSKSQEEKDLLKEYFNDENQNFEFVRFYYGNGTYPLSHPEYLITIEYFLEILDMVM
jgi:hypothetical protein